MVERTLLKDTLQVQRLSWPLANSSIIIKPGKLVPVQVKAKWSVSGFPTFYEKYLILQPVHEFEMCVTVLQLGAVEHRRLALHLTSSSSTQILIHPLLT